MDGMDLSAPIAGLGSEEMSALTWDGTKFIDTKKNKGGGGQDKDQGKGKGKGKDKGYGG